MFDQTFVTNPAQTRKPWTVAVSLAIQTLFACIILILPLLHIAALHAPDRTAIWLPLQTPPHPPQQLQPENPAPRLVRPGIFIAPVGIPAHIDMTPDAPEIGSTLGSGPAEPFLTLGAGPIIQPPPPAQVVKPAPPPPPAAPIRVSTGAQAARLIYAPKPAYPALARAARVQGVVKLQAIVSRDGAIKNLQVVSGPPLLVAAAIAAVQQWRYQPTLLSAEPVEVATEIDVNFTLSQ